MSAALATLPPPSTALMLLEARVLPEFGAFWLMRPWLSAVASPGDGHPVLVLPGLLADDSSTHALRSFLNSHSYAAFGWELGRNLGMGANLERDMLARIDELFERHGRRRISLVGWSLGGLYARQLAKIVPDKVRCLITLVTPFAGSPKSTNAWRTYEIVSGHKIEDQDIPDALVDAPPADDLYLQPHRWYLRLAGLPEQRGSPGREHRGLCQPLRPRPSSGSRLRRCRPLGPTGECLERI